MEERRVPPQPASSGAVDPARSLAIGDFWFEYPFYDNGPWPEETGIVAPSNSSLWETRPRRS